MCFARNYVRHDRLIQIPVQRLVIPYSTRSSQVPKLQSIRINLQSSRKRSRRLRVLRMATSNTSISDSSSRSVENSAQPSVIVFSGGSAFNAVSEKLGNWTTNVSYILPVSDDGGSTAEIVRVIGGPALGDIRSRCLRLADESDAESRAVKALLRYRLPANNPEAAKGEWLRIIEGKHALWNGLTSPYKHTIRRFLIHFQTEILLNCRMHFDYRNGSVGNFFFAGARLFFHSLEAAIFLFSRVARIPEGSRVIPTVDTEERLTLGAQLENGIFIRGQSEISHPSISIAESHLVDKSHNVDGLPAAIHRVFYLASEGTGVEHEVQFNANESVLSALHKANIIVYGMGSFYTSICPSLILKGVGEVISKKDCPKIIALNGVHDRETSVRLGSRGTGPMTAADVVQALTDSLNRMCCSPQQLNFSSWNFITHVIYPKHGKIEVDHAELTELGIKRVMEVESHTNENGNVFYDPEKFVIALEQIYKENTIILNPLSNGDLHIQHKETYT